MEIIKFRSQLEAALESARVNLRRAEHTVKRVGGSVVDRSRALQQALRVRERKLSAASLDALVVAKTKIIKFRSQLEAALESARANLWRAEHTVKRVGGSVVDRSRASQRALRASERKVLAASLDAVVVAKTKIIKFRSQLEAVLEPVRANL